MAVERELKLASDHMRAAAEMFGRELLRAEQRDRPLSEGIPTLKTGSEDGSWIGWQPADVAAAKRAMTPDEIRADELKSVAERIGLISAASHRPLDVKDEVQRVIAGRIAALRPEQPSENLDEREDPGLFKNGFNQNVEDGLTIDANALPVPIFGGRLTIKIELAAGTRAYDIPPYQVEQLRGIADGFATLPTNALDAEDTRVNHLSDLLEKVTKAQSKLDKVGATQAALQLLQLDLDFGSVNLLNPTERSLLGSSVADALRGFIEG